MTKKPEPAPARRGSLFRGSKQEMEEASKPTPKSTAKKEEGSPEAMTQVPEPNPPTSVGPGAPIKEQLAARARSEEARAEMKRAASAPPPEEEKPEEK